MKKTIVILLLALLGGTHAYSQTELYGTSLRIGKIGDIGNKDVPVGGLTQQYNIDFTGYRDVRPDQVGARIPHFGLIIILQMCPTFRIQD